MSWSEGSDRISSNLNDKTKQAIAKKKLESLDALNSVLARLAADEDLHEDLKLPIVMTAIQHWTGQSRLPPGDISYSYCYLFSFLSSFLLYHYRPTFVLFEFCRPCQ